MAENEKRELGKQENQAAGVARQLAAAIELPIVLVASVVVGGLLGYGLDHWLHTGPFGMLIGGALGFAAGIRELLRRLSKDVSS